MKCLACRSLLVFSVACAATDSPADRPDDDSATMREAGVKDASTAEACASEDVTVGSNLTPRPIDIVWVIDSSDSMRDEPARVQENMNRFVERFGSSDVQTVLITNKARSMCPRRWERTPRASCRSTSRSNRTARC